MLGVKSMPLLSFGKIHPSRLLLRRKLQESFRKAGSGLEQSQYSAEPTAGTCTAIHLAVQPLLSKMPGLWGSRRAALSPVLSHPFVSLHMLV